MNILKLFRKEKDTRTPYEKMYNEVDRKAHELLKKFKVFAEDQNNKNFDFCYFVPGYYINELISFVKKELSVKIKVNRELSLGYDKHVESDLWIRKDFEDIEIVTKAVIRNNIFHIGTISKLKDKYLNKKYKDESDYFYYPDLVDLMKLVYMFMYTEEKKLKRSIIFIKDENAGIYNDAERFALQFLVPALPYLNLHSHKDVPVGYSADYFKVSSFDIMSRLNFGDISSFNEWDQFNHMKFHVLRDIF